MTNGSELLLCDALLLEKHLLASTRQMSILNAGDVVCETSNSRSDLGHCDTQCNSIPEMLELESPGPVFKKTLTLNDDAQTLTNALVLLSAELKLFDMALELVEKALEEFQQLSVMGPGAFRNNLQDAGSIKMATSIGNHWKNFIVLLRRRAVFKQ